MAIWRWTEEFIDVREITVEADTLKEAQAKADAGDWDSEDTINFYSNRLVKPMSGPHSE
jgi:hypothetical protein